MRLRGQLKTLAFLYNLMNSGICALPSGKPLFYPEAHTDFQEALPEQEGIRSSALLDMFSSLSSDRHINPHSAIVLRNGRIIAKADWEPYTADLPHVSHSLAKSITSMICGIAVNEKYFSTDETLDSIFGYSGKYTREITIENLLTMSSGVAFNEAGTLMSQNWVHSFLDSDVLFEAGTEFHYNSMNSYMLSAALCKRTGMSLSEYISCRLFTPMGIKKFYWEKCPSGIEKGGWGLYLSPYDYAKLGQLWLDDGSWNGVRLVPKEWVYSASSAHIRHEHLCSDGYGYHVWRGKHGSVFSGMFGQLIYSVPAKNMVIVLTAGSENLFPCEGALKYIDRFLDNKDNFSKSPFVHFKYSDTAALRKALSSAKFGNALDISDKNTLFYRIKRLFKGKYSSPEKIMDGIVITLEKNNVHLLPLLIQTMEGCFSQGLGKVLFSLNDDQLYMQLDFNDGSVKIPIGAESPSHFTYNGYSIASQFFLSINDDDLPVFKIQICFLESSCTKIMKFIFTDDDVTLKIRESPKLYTALDEISLLTTNQLGEGLRRTLEAVLESDIADYKIKSFIEPTIKGTYRLST